MRIDRLTDGVTYIYIYIFKLQKINISAILLVKKLITIFSSFYIIKKTEKINLDNRINIKNGLSKQKFCLPYLKKIKHRVTKILHAESLELRTKTVT